MSQLAIWTWKDETPGSVPAGARISAGKFGSVARSFPKSAEAAVNRVPTSCMPSPESPANRRTTLSRASGSVGAVKVSSGTSIISSEAAAKPPPAHLCWHRGAAHDRDSLCQMIEVPAHLVWGFRCSADSRARGPTDRCGRGLSGPPEGEVRAAPLRPGGRRPLKPVRPLRPTPVEAALWRFPRPPGRPRSPGAGALTTSRR